MSRNNNILAELQDLNSSLENVDIQPVYQVPAGYFEGLADFLLLRIRAMEAVNAKDELYQLSPYLAGISRQLPFSVPDGYFDSLVQNTPVPAANDVDASKELETLSPFLGSLKKETPYVLPGGYFENLDTGRKVEAHEKQAKVVSLGARKWFRYAAAAVLVGVIPTVGLLLTSRKNSYDPNTHSAEWVQKNLKKVSTDAIDHFVDLAEPGIQDIAAADTRNEAKDKNDVKDLIKDISDKDIQKFLDDTQTDNVETDDALLN